MGDAVEQRRSHLGITEDGRPLAEGEVGGDDDAGALIKLADEVEQQLPAGAGERQITELVEYDQVEPRQLRRQGPAFADPGLLFKACHQPVARKLRSDDVLAVLAELFVTRGPPAHIRSDNGPEFIATAVQQWLAQIGVKTLYITPRSPCENGYIDSFNGRLRDELLDGEIFYGLEEVRCVTGLWREHYNSIRPPSSLGYRPPAPETIKKSTWPLGSLPLRSASRPGWHRRRCSTNSAIRPVVAGSPESGGALRRTITNRKSAASF